MILGPVEAQRLPCYPPRYLHLGSGASLPELSQSDNCEAGSLLVKMNSEMISDVLLLIVLLTNHDNVHLVTIMKYTKFFIWIHIHSLTDESSGSKFNVKF